MIITCPNCSLGKEVGAISIPREGTLATCPRCRARFNIKPEQSKTSVVLGRIFLGVAALGVLLAVILFSHDWKLDKNYFLTPSAWQGEMTYVGRKHPFLLVIEKAQDGQLTGYMDWVATSPRYRLAVRGTYAGNHLLFEDYEFLEGKGTAGLFDKKDVYIIGNEMIGTDKNGSAAFYAVRRASP